MGDTALRVVISLIGTLIALLVFIAGYISGSHGWWWSGFSLLIFYFIIFYMVKA